MGKWFDRLRKDPTPWLLERACPPIKLRTLVEVMGRDASDFDVAQARQECCNYKPATTISTDQSDDGTWFHSLLGYEPRNAQRRRGPGTRCQILALSEFGWGNDHPIIWRSIDLFKALQMGATNVDLYELKGYCGGNGTVEAYFRRWLSRNALGVLSRLGLAGEEPAKSNVVHLIDELDRFYSGDIEKKLYVGKHTRQIEGPDKVPVDEVCEILSLDAPAPDHVLWLTLAFAPGVRSSAKGRAVLERITDFMFAAAPPPVQVVEVNGRIFDREEDFITRTLDVAGISREKRVGRLLQELELMARAGVLESVPKAMELLEWVIGLQDEEGVVRAEDHMEKFSHAVDYPYFPLEDNWRGKHKKFTDTTFRLCLILRLLDAEK